MATNNLTPPTMTYDEVDLTFADSSRSFTASVNQYWNNPIITNGTVTRKRCRLSLIERFDISLTRKMTAYLYDEWRDIMDYVWSITPAKQRDIIQLSITFFGTRVEKINIEEANPTSEKNVAFILDRDTPSNAYIEFKTCCNRICGRKGIRLTKSDVINHLNDSNRISIENNTNTLFLKPKYAYTPLSELVPSQSSKSSGFVYGYITMAAELKACTGKHQYYKQIRIRDSSLNWDADDLQIMFFGNDPNKFPNCRESDLIRIHRCEINYRAERNVFQAIVQLDSRFLAFIVINGNLTIANNKEAVKHSFSESYTFDELVDGYFIKYLKVSCRLRQEQTNPDLVDLTKQNAVVRKVDVPNVLGVNRIPIKMLSEIEAEDERVTILVMITARVDIVEDRKDQDSEMDNEQFVFYWAVMDGSRCVRNKSLLEFYRKEDEDINVEKKKNDGMQMDEEEEKKIWRCDNVYNDNEAIMGSYVKILVNPEYETAIQCYQDIHVGEWVMLINILYDREKKQLIYDMHSQIDSKMTSKTNEDIGRRQDLIYYHIYKATQAVSNVSTVAAHHQFQSFSVIRAILDTKDIHCKYRIRGKCVRFHPPKVEDFTKSGNGLQFILWIKDSSSEALKVIFEGKSAQRFFGMEEIGDLKDAKYADQVKEIEQCLDLIMRETSYMDLCIRSYKPTTRNLILYKAIDTVLVK